MIMMEKQANVNFNFNFYGQYAWNQIYIHVAIYHTQKKHHKNVNWLKRSKISTILN